MNGIRNKKWRIFKNANLRAEIDCKCAELNFQIILQFKVYEVSWKVYKIHHVYRM